MAAIEKFRLMMVLTAALTMTGPPSSRLSSATSIESPSGRTPSKHSVAGIESQFGKGDKEGLTLILAPDTPEIGRAAFKGDTAALQRLLTSGVNIESAGEDHRTPLFLACTGHIEAVTMLLAAGANVNARDVTGATPLHWSTERRDTCIVFLLLSHRAKLNIQDEFGVTPLMWAAITGDKLEVQAFLAAGAKKELTDADGLTASDWAKKNGFAGIASLLTPSLPKGR
jgi:ankyrin repeat protein